MRRLLFISLMLFSLQSVAEDRGIKIVAESGESVGHYENSYALVIGVSDYTNGWPDLNAVPSELADVEELLTQQNFKITKVINPDSKQLQAAFEDFVDQYGYSESNRLLFYFSGHGHTRANNTKGYLVPTDAPNPLRDDKGFVRASYAMSSLLALARQIESHHALFLFDSCFSGTIFKTKALPDQPPLITRLTAEPVRQFITAGDAGEEVPAKSVFTPAFIDSIKYGLADLNKDGYVTGSELGMHLQSVVSGSSIGMQTPQYGKINDYELQRGDFVFVRNIRKALVNKEQPVQKEKVVSADFDKGLAAYENGDFKTALREFKPLAEQGDSDAQYNLGVKYEIGGGGLIEPRTQPDPPDPVDPYGTGTLEPDRRSFPDLVPIELNVYKDPCVSCNDRDITICVKVVNEGVRPINQNDEFFIRMDQMDRKYGGNWYIKKMLGPVAPNSELTLEIHPRLAGSPASVTIKAVIDSGDDRENPSSDIAEANEDNNEISMVYEMNSANAELSCNFSEARDVDEENKPEKGTRSSEEKSQQPEKGQTRTDKKRKRGDLSHPSGRGMTSSERPSAKKQRELRSGSPKSL